MNLIKYIRKNYDPNFNFSDLPFSVIQRKIKKGTIIHSYYEIGNQMYFINEGVVETTIIHKEKETTLSFCFPHSFFSAYDSAVNRELSKVQSTTITDCIIEEYSIKDFHEACETSFLLNKIGRIEMEKAFLKKNKREIAFLTKTKEEMYIDIIKNNPEFIQQIPLKKIANYLGILPETLSRIRKRIIS